MESRATLKNLRMSPRKVRRIAFPLRGMLLERAEGYLGVLPHAAAPPLKKLIASAAANALQLGAHDRAGLVIKEVRVNQGTTLRRFRPRSRGMTHPIAKRVSHVTVVLEGAGTRVRKSASPTKGAGPAPIQDPALALQEDKATTTIPKAIPKAPEILKKGLKPIGKFGDIGRRVFRRKVI